MSPVSCHSFPKASANLSSSWPSSSFEVVGHKVFCRSSGYCPHVCRNGLRWAYRNAAEIPWFAQSSGFVTAPKAGRSGLTLTSANHAVISLMIWVFNEQRQAFAQVVRLGQNSVPHTWLLNTGPIGYDNQASDLHQLCRVAQMRVLHGLRNRPNIVTTMIYRMLERRQDHTNRFAVQRHYVRLDSEDEQSWFVQWNEDTPLQTFNQHNLTNWCLKANVMENMVQLRSPGVLVRVRFNFVIDDYCDEYEMKSMENRLLVNWIIAWIA